MPLALAVWGLGAIALLAALGILHGHAVPADSLVSDALAAKLATSPPAPRWRMLHVLCERCGCSGAIVDGLVRRAPVADVDERVLLVGDGPRLADRLRARGYPIDHVDAAAARDAWGIRVLPILLVCDPQGVLVHAGAHLDRPGDPRSHDLEILAELRAGRRRQPAAVVGGCATAPEFLPLVDPTGVARLMAMLGAPQPLLGVAVSASDSAASRTGPGQRDR